jgi:Zn-dependent peptidase ImmA (M78 family)
MNSKNKTDKGASDSAESILVALRRMLPDRPLTVTEALRYAERQAHRLLQLHNIRDVPVPIEVITELPKIVVEYDDDLPRYVASGASSWDANGQRWVISINPFEPPTRQRLSVLHEAKHILDHYHPGLHGGSPQRLYGLDPVEYIADYFAGCVLVPGRWLRQAFNDGIQRVEDLAELFDVSPRAIQVRLAQVNLRSPGSHRSSRQHRHRPATQPPDRDLGGWKPAHDEETAA